MAKYCSNCGNEINENDDICLFCNSNVNTNNNKLKCQKCQSDNVSIQIINKNKLVTKHRGILWWLIIGWWWLPVKWLIFTIPALIFKVFGIGKKQKIINIEQKKAICQNCGNCWNIK